MALQGENFTERSLHHSTPLQLQELDLHTFTTANNDLDTLVYGVNLLSAALKNAHRGDIKTQRNMERPVHVENNDRGHKDEKDT